MILDDREIPQIGLQRHIEQIAEDRHAATYRTSMPTFAAIRANLCRGTPSLAAS